jgi:glycosyltransferase involved in cell wall biosynthesis
LLEDKELRLRCGENARRFAETAFDIDRIADRFEAIFAELVPAAETLNRAS